MRFYIPMNSIVLTAALASVIVVSFPTKMNVLTQFLFDSRPPWGAVKSLLGSKALRRDEIELDFDEGGDQGF